MRASALGGIVVVIAGAACTAPSNSCDPNEDESYELSIDVTTQTVVDELDLYFDDFDFAGITYPNPLATGPLTPALLESGTPGPTSYSLRQPIETTVTVSPPALGGVVTYYNDVSIGATSTGVIAKLDSQVVGFGWTSQLAEQASCPSVDVVSGSIAATMNPPAVEMWGSGAGLPCFRGVGLDGKTYYLVRADDVDCDGIPNGMDYCPYTYCDPNGDAALQAGCSCD